MDWIRIRNQNKKKKINVFKSWMFSLEGWGLILEIGIRSWRYNKKIMTLTFYYEIFHFLVMNNLRQDPDPDMQYGLQVK